MIRNTFLHIPHIGEGIERRLWCGGIASWSDFHAQESALRFSPMKKNFMRRWLDESETRLAAMDATFFAKALPHREHWRAFEEFGNHAGFLDIETDGDSMITVIGLFDGAQMHSFVNGQNLDEFPSAVAEYSMLVTFNGAQFDLPMLRRTFPSARLDHLHLDLRFALQRMGLHGGLKAIETRVQIARSKETAGMNGYDAVILWHRYVESNDEEALRQLLQYNREDVENLLPLARLAYRELRRAVLPSS